MANSGYFDENSDVSAILFDLDNTLIQTRKGDTKACNKVCIFWYFSILSLWHCHGHGSMGIGDWQNEYCQSHFSR